MKFSFNIQNIKAIIPEEFKEDYALTPLSKYCSSFSLNHIPAIERRKLSKSMKCVLSILPNINKPIVYATYKGEINRSLDLLCNLAKNEIVSPISFSMAVLNSVPAISSILYKNHNDIVALSSVPSLENALLQAYINMYDTKESQVIISYYEGAYKEYFKQDNFYCCLSMELVFGNNITIEKIASEEKHGIAENISEIEFLKHYELKENYSIYTDYSEWKWYFNA